MFGSFTVIAIRCSVRTWENGAIRSALSCQIMAGTEISGESVGGFQSGASILIPLGSTAD